MIIKIALDITERFGTITINEVNLNDAINDEKKTKSFIIAKVNSLGLCYKCRKPLDSDFTYVTQREVNMIMFCSDNCKRSY